MVLILRKALNAPLGYASFPVDCPCALRWLSWTCAITASASASVSSHVHWTGTLVWCIAYADAPGNASLETLSLGGPRLSCPTPSPYKGACRRLSLSGR